MQATRQLIGGAVSLLHWDQEVFMPPKGVTYRSAQLAVLSRARREGADRLGQILFHNLRTYLLDDLLVKTDRMTMAASLEARSPFLDTALVELAFRIPAKLKMRRGSLTWLLRETYRDVLPSEILASYDLLHEAVRRALADVGVTTARRGACAKTAARPPSGS